MTNKDQNDLADREAHIARVAAGRDFDPDYARLAEYLRANPGHTVRDYKGLGPSAPAEPRPWEKVWQKVTAEEVRAAALAATARDLPCNVRQAAARDPGLIWNPLARKYRLRLPSDPLPGVKSSEMAPERTGGDPRKASKHAFSAQNTRAHPRP